MEILLLFKDYKCVIKAQRVKTNFYTDSTLANYRLLMEPLNCPDLQIKVGAH